MHAVRASAITDLAWLRAQFEAAGRVYRTASPPLRATLWWYSASSVLVAPSTERLVRTGDAVDPALAATVLLLKPDGTPIEAACDSVIGSGAAVVGPRLGDALGAAIDAVVAVAEVSERAMWAIASDSLANRLNWAGASDELVGELAAAIGARLPVPRFFDVGGQRVVRRASCCLIYETPGGQKCTSCPRQDPQERDRRIRTALGLP